MFTFWNFDFLNFHCLTHSAMSTVGHFDEKVEITEIISPIVDFRCNWDWQPPHDRGDCSQRHHPTSTSESSLSNSDSCWYKNDQQETLDLFTFTSTSWKFKKFPLSNNSPLVLRQARMIFRGMIKVSKTLGPTCPEWLTQPAQTLESGMIDAPCQWHGPA